MGVFLGRVVLNAQRSRVASVEMTMFRVASGKHPEPLKPRAPDDTQPQDPPWSAMRPDPDPGSSQETQGRQIHAQGYAGSLSDPA